MSSGSTVVAVWRQLTEEETTAGPIAEQWWLNERGSWLLQVGWSQRILTVLICYVDFLHLWQRQLMVG